MGAEPTTDASSQDKEARTGVPARPAATVVVVRPAAAAFEVLLLRRHDKVAFMGGAYVFPGGRVDDADRQHAGSDVERWTSRFRDLSPPAEHAYRTAAVRELREEANVQIAPADLVPLAHWVTPEFEPRRYDTRFFIARMPDGQQAVHDDHETTALAWLTPDAALDRCLAGDIMLPPPTWTTLKWLARSSTIADAVAEAIRTTIVRIQPNLVRTSETLWLTLPGDPTHPLTDPWDVPDETRFMLKEGRWLPMRASSTDLIG